MIPARDELLLTIDEAQWNWLRSHLERGGLILVSDSLDLADAAHKVASDDTDTIESWIQDGKISKPTDSQIKAWDALTDKKFSMLIIRPYILIQERLPTTH